MIAFDFQQTLVTIFLEFYHTVSSTVIDCLLLQPWDVQLFYFS
jgi:hypothetical protein